MPPKSNPSNLNPQAEQSEQPSSHSTNPLSSLPHPQPFNFNLQRAKLDQDALNSSQVSGSTIYTGSVAGGRGELSVSGHEDDGASMRTSSSYLSNTDPSRFLRQLGGRIFNATNEDYFLPADDDEWQRLNKEHIAYMIGLGGLYPEQEVVEALLAPEEGKQKRILDLGSGSGTWAVDMAKKFPHVQVTGIDLVQVPVDPEDLPPNCQFEIDDIRLGLTHFQGKFDFVHARVIASWMEDRDKALKNIHMCLRPGGIMVWMDGDYDFYTPDVHVYRTIASPSNPSGSWFARIFYEIRRASLTISGNPINEMLRAIDEGLWDNPLFDPDTCKTGSLYLPLGNWATHATQEQTQMLSFAGSLFKQDLQKGHRGAQELLIGSGIPADTLAEWVRRADEELATSQPPIVARMRLAWGRRRAAPGRPAPPLPSRAPDPSPNPSAALGGRASEGRRPLPYPLYYVYNTKQQALAELALRDRNKDFPPPPIS